MTTPPCVMEERGSKLMVSLDRANSFNQAARDVMNKNGVRINDLYSVIGNKRDVYQKGPNDVHYNQEGRKVLAEAVAQEIRRAIQQKDKIKKSVLFIAGNTKHRHGFHEYKAGSILLADALNTSGIPIEAKVHWYGWPEDESIFDGVDACIIYADGGGEFGENTSFFTKK